MGFRFRKSFKIAPGVKLNVNKKSIGLSVGSKNARVSVNSKGKVTKSISIPGTGISYTDTHTVGTNSKTKTKKQNNSNVQKTINNNSKKVQTNTSKKSKDKSSYLLLLKALFALMIIIGLIATATDLLTGFVFTIIGCLGMHYCVKSKDDTKPFYKKRWQIAVFAMFILLSIINLTA